MDGRTPAAGVGVVDDVVVDEGCGMEQLDGRGDPGDAGLRSRVAAAELEAPPGDERADPLALRGELADRVDELRGAR